MRRSTCERRQRGNALIAQLVFELTVRQRAMNIAQRLLDESNELAAVLELDFNVCLIFRD